MVGSVGGGGIVAFGGEKPIIFPKHKYSVDRCFKLLFVKVFYFYPAFIAPRVNISVSIIGYNITI